LARGFPLSRRSFPFFFVHSPGFFFHAGISRFVQCRTALSSFDDDHFFADYFLSPRLFLPHFAKPMLRMLSPAPQRDRRFPPPFSFLILHLVPQDTPPVLARRFATPTPLCPPTLSPLKPFFTLHKSWPLPPFPASGKWGISFPHVGPQFNPY